jgi:molecular chaperone GrpE (heat shock protein)
MSIAEIASALIGLRETTYKDHQRVSSSVDELRGSVQALQETVEQTLDKRLAASAQAVLDIQRQISDEYEGRLEAVLMALIEVTDRLAVLADNADSSDDTAELQERLRSISAPRDRLRRVLEDHGVRAFACEGEPYDPLRHEVVRREFMAECTSEYVLNELRPGYVREGTEHTLVRAKVIVAAPPIVEGRTDG